MTDEQLSDTWTTLEPALRQRRRIEARVFAWLDAHDTSIAAEWLGLFKMSPFAALGLVTATAVWMLAATPIGWLARALISR